MGVNLNNDAWNKWKSIAIQHDSYECSEITRFLNEGHLQRVAGARRILQIHRWFKKLECGEIYGVAKGQSWELQIHSLLKMDISPRYKKELIKVYSTQHPEGIEQVQDIEVWDNPIIEYQLVNLSKADVNSIAKSLTGIQVPIAYSGSMYEDGRGMFEAWTVKYGEHNNGVTINWVISFAAPDWQEFRNQVAELVSTFNKLMPQKG